MNFECPRSCRWAEHKDVCRFMPVLSKLGPGVVTSHTTTIKAEFRDHDRLGGAVVAMGGKVLGMGSHKLYSEHKTGFGFTLPGWSYPIVCEANGSLAFDNFGERWGKSSDLERLKGEYVIQTAEQSAMAQGWLTERVGETLVVHHPSGGSLVVTANGAEANGFAGVGCHSALMSLNLPMDQWTAKPTFGQVECEIQVGAG